MDTLTNAMESTFAWLWQSSLEASLVVLLILAARLVTPRRHAATLFPALWLLLIVHMLLPWRPESALSVANVLHRPEAISQVESLPVTIEFGSTTPNLKSVAETAPSTVLAPPLTEVPSTSDRVHLIAFACWLGGLLYVLMIVMRRYAAFRKTMRQTSQPANPAFQSKVDECRVAMGMRKSPRVLITHDALSPALVGIFRPTLLISEAMLGRLTDAEWRCVISHELAHLKRHDIALNWLTTLLQAIHWFNPLVWFAFRRMRSDREIACDALALASSSPNKSTLYAETLVKLLKVHTNPKPLVGMAMILENKSNLKRRMNMIMRFNPAEQRWSILSIFTVCLVALGCLTNPQTVTDDPSASKDSTTRTMHLNYLGTDEVIGKIEEFGAKERIALGIVSLSKKNALAITTDTLHEFEKISDFIQRLDQPKKQISIEAYIVEAIMKDENQSGRDWVAEVFSQHTMLHPSGTTTPDEANENGFGILDKATDLARIMAEQVDTKSAEILVNPVMVTLQGQLATFKVGQDIPYRTITHASDSQPVATVKQQFIGTSFSVLPNVMEDGFIHVELNYETSVVADLNAQPPIFSTSKIQSAIMLKPDQTVFLSGLNRNQRDLKTSETILFLTCSILY